MFLTTIYNETPSSIFPRQGVEKIKGLGFDYAILVDKNFSALPEFYKACKKNEIKPIIGLDITIGGLDLVLLAKNQNGYFHICSLISKKDFSISDVLENPNVSIIIHDYKEEKLLDGVFSNKNIYGGFSNSADSDKMSRIKRIWEKCPDEQILPFFKPTYLVKSDTDGVRSLEAIKNKKKLRSIPSYKFEGLEVQNPLLSKLGGIPIVESAPYLKDNILTLTESVEDDYTFDSPVPPKYIYLKDVLEQEKKLFPNTSPLGKTEIDLLRHLTIKGLEKRNISPDKLKELKYLERLDRELDVISSMGFCGYILIVWDIIDAMIKMNIPIGPGRGSGAGSLVLFSLFITDIDPMPLGLLFERFLNPYRNSMPDIDTDVAKDDRNTLIEYVSSRFGKDNVAQIPAFDKLQAKSSLKDAVRILDFPKECGEALVKHIEKDESLTDAYNKRSEKIENTIDYYSAYSVWAYATKLEGLIRNNSIHPAGFVISDEPISQKNSVMKVGDVNTIHFDGNNAEFGGLIKFDFLSLKTLSILKDTLSLIKKRTGVDINLKSLTLDDPEVFSYISNNSLDGIFQLESKGMQELCRELAPSSYEELISILSLYRPGVLGSDMLDVYIRRKKGLEKTTYFSDEFEPVLKPILESTYGVIIYQEQVMKIVEAIGGFSLAKADLVRRAMSKKDKEELRGFAIDFAKGAVEKGFVENHALGVFQVILEFAGYGFNKSHSAAYSVLVYFGTYLKMNYPLEYMTTLLSHADESAKIEKYLMDAVKIGIPILPPDINTSSVDFSIHDNSIVYSFSSIKGIGTKGAMDIVNCRDRIPLNENSLFIKDKEKSSFLPFDSFEDFTSRMNGREMNSDSLFALIKSGAFSSIDTSQKKLLLKSGYKKITQPDIPYTLTEKISFEKETLGLIVSDPLAKAKKFMSTFDLPDLSDIPITLKREKQHTWVFCLPISVEEKLNKKDKTFLAVELFYNHQVVKIFIHNEKAITSFKKALSGGIEGSENKPSVIGKPVILGLERTLDSDGRSSWLNVAIKYVKNEITPLVSGPYPSVAKGVFKKKEEVLPIIIPSPPEKKPGGEFLSKIK